ncbi:MAG: cation transporter [Promethearchaeota archaeon]|nr:MAG: cation transporter [Candidatus Lokiarchaeota archaeon]
MEEKKDFSQISSQLFEYRSVEKKRLILSLTITLIVMIVEIIGGVIASSIALISDAGHMFTHAFAIGISLLAIYIAKRPPCHHKTFGLYRSEILAAFINGIFLLTIIGFIVYEAVMRFLNPTEVAGFYMFFVALVGLAVNLSSIIILSKGKTKTLNVRSVFFHMIADAASSIGIVIIAVIINYTNWYLLDPLVSIGISIIILYWAIGILKESTRILLEVAPKGLDVNMIANSLKENFSEIDELFNMHLWTITPDMLVFSAYLALKTETNESQKNDLIIEINNFLYEKYNIIESTIQVVSQEYLKSCNIN